ncbi:hypothetical protein ACRB8A_12420 [Arthrobacter sp. G.S.26]|uniref:hypothetical protein n=1 Tax=Arthrobacter sp. G.S.26 TaxID=3433706 RepID=UPI003D77D377
MFTSKAEHYGINIKQGVTINAKPALMTTDNGEHIAAVVVFKSRQIQSVLPLADALRLANEIADAIAAHRIATHN